MHVDLSHTPGLLYALAYWLSSTFYIQLYGSPFSKGKKFGISAGFLALIAGFMTLTDGVSAIGFFPCMGVTVALIFFYIRIATHMPWANAGYYCARAFILGEFSASLAWYLFYFFVTVPGLPLTVWTTILVFAAVHAIILYTMFLLERKYRDGSKLIKITGAGTVHRCRPCHCRLFRQQHQLCLHRNALFQPVHGGNLHHPHHH